MPVVLYESRIPLIAQMTTRFANENRGQGPCTPYVAGQKIFQARESDASLTICGDKYIGGIVDEFPAELERMLAAQDRDLVQNVQGAGGPWVLRPVAAETEIACRTRINPDEWEAEKSRIGHARIDAVCERIHVGIDGIICVVEVGIATPEFIYHRRTRRPGSSPRTQLNTSLEIGHPGRATRPRRTQLVRAIIPNPAAPAVKIRSGNRMAVANVIVNFCYPVLLCVGAHQPKRKRAGARIGREERLARAGSVIRSAWNTTASRQPRQLCAEGHHIGSADIITSIHEALCAIASRQSLTPFSSC